MPTGRRSRRRPWHEPVPELDLGRVTGGRAVEVRRGREWTVQSVRGNDRTYRCPGCQQPVAAGTPHIVAWERDGVRGDAVALEERRHWHTACWRRG